MDAVEHCHPSKVEKPAKQRLSGVLAQLGELPSTAAVREFATKSDR